MVYNIMFHDDHIKNHTWWTSKNQNDTVAVRFVF